MADRAPFRVHQDPVLFREAVIFTAAETRFAPRLIEKDYFCSVILQHLEAATADLIFRGGTCLAKVHVGFYRLSEDLDFLIPTPVNASRAERSRRIAGFKADVAALARELPGLRVTAPLTGANDSSQYAATLGYHSMLGSGEESVTVEVGLREPLLTPSVRDGAQTLLLDPISGTPLVPPLLVTCLSRSEAMAEKLRAALSRREAAVRDFYDVDHAVRRLDFQVRDAKLIELVKKKLAIPGNEPVDVSANRLAALKRQIDSQLKPVLRDRDFAEFDLDRAFATVAEVAATLG